jgi:hypothetical protein
MGTKGKEHEAMAREIHDQRFSSRLTDLAEATGGAWAIPAT